VATNIVHEIFGPPGQSIPGNPLSEAIGRRLGLDDPGGKTAFMASFKSSHPPDITQRTESMQPSVREELVHKLAGGGG
jgi:hypothetical protein